ncbi:GntG family PLP-dependent aldolase [Bosea sp. TWI1241]|uniref:threonine aldolase family protein n=1 Tax=Bosea sp. TWI1241 TaxID=3148904 RepID=UPI003207BCE3
MASKIALDFFSDTKTRPTQGMRAAMMAAEVGDEQKGEDPTVIRLCERVAELLGQEDAVLLPSGTMCNQIALALHCRPGDEVICDRTSHIVNSEGGGPAALAGVMLRTLDGERGIFGSEAVAAAVRPASRYVPRSRLLSVEQTNNFGGGSVWPLATLRAVLAEARKAGLAAHMDGARLLNAVVASGVPARDFAGGFDSAWIDLTKGLGGPVGAVLAGSRDFIREVWRLKQRLGGAMRQSGFLAAAGLYALDHHVERLAEDHANARRLAMGLAGLPGIRLPDAPVETNIVFFDVSGTGLTAEGFVAACGERGLGVGAFGPSSVRMVTHLDVGAADVERALEIIAQIAR